MSYYTLSRCHHTDLTREGYVPFLNFDVSHGEFFKYEGSSICNENPSITPSTDVRI